MCEKVKCQTHFAHMTDIVKPILTICTLFNKEIQDVHR